eukprot:4617983-Amphidinium_carterae.1
MGLVGEVKERKEGTHMRGRNSLRFLAKLEVSAYTAAAHSLLFESYALLRIGTIVATTVVHCLAEELSTEQGLGSQWQQ